jgi:hypothetical protein
MPEINGTNNNSIQTMLESLNSSYSNTTNGNNTASLFAPTNSKDATSALIEDFARRTGISGPATTSSKDATTAIIEEFARRTGIGGPTTASPTSSVDTAQPAPAAAPAKKKKKKGGFFKKLGGFFKKVGGFLKKALPIISTIAMFIPGIGTAVGAALKIATAAMGAIDGIKSGNIFGAVTSIAGAFTGGATNMLGKLGSVGGYIQKGVDMFKNSGVGSLVTKGFDLFNKGKEYLNKFTGGIGEKVTNFFNTKGLDIFKNLTGGIGGKLGQLFTEKGPDWIKSLASRAGSTATNWLNEKATSLFDKVTNSPFVQKARSFFDSGIGKTLIDLFTKKAA